MPGLIKQLTFGTFLPPKSKGGAGVVAYALLSLFNYGACPQVMSLEVAFLSPGFYMLSPPGLDKTFLICDGSPPRPSETPLPR